MELFFVGDRVSTAWSGRYVSSLEGFSEGDSRGGSRRGGGETFAGESEVMTEVGDGFIRGGQFSKFFFTGVVGFEGKRLQTRLASCLFYCLLMRGICCDGTFSTGLGLYRVTVAGVL